MTAGESGRRSPRPQGSSEQQLVAGVLIDVQLLLSKYAVCSLCEQIVYVIHGKERVDCCMTSLLPGMLPYRVRSSCRRMSRTTARCGGQPTSTWPRIPATASLFMNFGSACIRASVVDLHTYMQL